MRNYYNLLVERKLLKIKLREEKQKLHKQFVSAHKGLFKIMDITVAILLLFNFGAVATTNALVVRAEPEIMIMEVNPAQASMNDYEPHPITQSKGFAWAILRQAFFWAFLIAAYVHYRRTVFTEEGLAFVLVIMAIYFVAFGMDFFNDLGFWIGRKLFGG